MTLMMVSENLAVFEHKICRFYQLIFCILPEQLKAIKIDTSDDFQPAPKVNDVIGAALSRIGPYKKLDNTKQVVALIDDVREI